jgi:pre-mRNA-splicing factor 18
MDIYIRYGLLDVWAGNENFPEQPTTVRHYISVDCSLLIMNALYAEIERKRKANEDIRNKISGESGQTTGTLKFVRQGDRKRMEELELEEKQKQLDLERSKRARVEEKQVEAAAASAPVKSTPTKADFARQYASLTVAQTKDRLRQVRQPITLFAETADERLNRLIEYISGDRSGDAFDDIKVGRNLSEDEDDEAELEAQDKADAAHSSSSSAVRSSGAAGSGTAGEDADSDGDDAPAGDRIEWDPSVHFSKMPGLSEEKIVYKFFRALTKQWEADLNLREEWVKRSAQGKKETKTQKQCKDYIRPLFRMCKRKEVPYDILDKLALMVKCCEEGNFLGANDQYIRYVQKKFLPFARLLVHL